MFPVCSVTHLPGLYPTESYTLPVKTRPPSASAVLLATLLIGACSVATTGKQGEAVTVTANDSDARLADKIDRFLAPLVDAHHLSGVVLVTRGDKTLVVRTYGHADWELGAPIKLASRFRIASITKTFTASAVVMLSERGKLSLKDPLSKYLPSFPNAEKIQLRHLLLHASGVPNPDSPACTGATLDDLLAEIGKKSFWFEPGTNSGYSNGGYAVLAKVVEVASGKPWESFLQEEIFAPLGLTGTAHDDQEAIVPNRVSGYAPGPSSIGIINAPCSLAQGAWGSGDLISTASDLERWARAVRDETLFKRASLEHPYGWGARRYVDREVIEQSGILNGTASYLAVYLKDDVTVVVLSNVQTGKLTEVGKGIGALTFGVSPAPLPTSPPAVAWTPAHRSRWIGRWNNPEFGFQLIERNRSLFLMWGNSLEGSYVFMTGEATAYNPQDSVTMQLTGESIRVSWGSDWKEFQRQK